ncbi:hypothetical protein Dimus_008786 [Dionaea muscipula]
MAKRRIKRTNQQALTADVNDSGIPEKKPQHEAKEDAIVNQEVERQISTVQAISDMEIEHLLTGVRLLRSYVSEEHLQLPVLQFFKENLPNLSIIRNGEDGHFSLQWKEDDGSIATNGDNRDFYASLLHHMSMAYTNLPAAIPSFGGFDFTSREVNSSLGADALLVGNYAMGESSKMQTFGMQDGLQTPGEFSQRMSVGMTPKTVRLPKPGEMLLSVRGSPLGVYKEDNNNVNMEAIRESDDS